MFVSLYSILLTLIRAAVVAIRLLAPGGLVRLVLVGGVLESEVVFRICAIAVNPRLAVFPLHLDGCGSLGKCCFVILTLRKFVCFFFRIQPGKRPRGRNVISSTLLRVWEGDGCLLGRKMD